jgi:tetraacyldisaccharide 4'-kinase
VERFLWSASRGAGAGWLAPAGAAVGAAAAARGALAHASRARLARPVVSVGGLSAGGAGKTPVARLVAEMLRAHGARVAVLTRGHPDVRRGDPPLVVLPPREGRPPGRTGGGAEGGARPAGPDAAPGGARPAGARPLPDQALLFARDGIPVGAHPVRARAAAALARAGATPDVYVLDDGFGHRSLERELDLVVLSWRDLHAPPRPFPAGPFREGWTSLRRTARVVIAGLDASRASALVAEARSDPPLHGPRRRGGDRATGGAAPAATDAALARVTAAAGEPPILAVLEPAPAVELEAWRTGAAEAAVAPGEAAAFSGIADPAAFERTLAQGGWRVRAHLVFPDHHRYGARDLRRAADLRPRGGVLVTTEKDAARLPPGAFPPGACAVLPVRARIVRGADALAGDLARLTGGAP